MLSITCVVHCHNIQGKLLPLLIVVYMQNSPDIKVTNYMGSQSAKVWSETSEDSNIVEEETLVQNSIPGNTKTRFLTKL